MDINSIFNAGGTTIKNPNYKKGNGQSEYITVSNLATKPTGSLVADIAYRAAVSGNQDIIDRNNSLDKYIKHGLTPTQYNIGSLDKVLVEQQSAATKFGNALAQAVVSEFLLGTAIELSDLVDLVGNAFKSDNDYTNPVSQYLEEKQEEFRNFAPIYADPNKHITNGGLTDAGWWASNLPSIVGSLALLVPSTGIVKGASYLGKALNIGGYTRQAVRAATGVSKKLQTARTMRAAGYSSQAIQDATKLNKFQRALNSGNTARGVSLFLENGTTAALSRAMENYKEARGTYSDMYTEASDTLSKMSDEEYDSFLIRNQDILNNQDVDINDRDAVAKHIASRAADKTFAMDWVNVAFDVIQMYSLRNAWKGIKNADGTPAAVRRAQIDAMKFGSEAEAKAAKAKWSWKKRASEKLEDFGYGTGRLFIGQGTEGIEEAINTIASKEGIHYGRTLLGSEEESDFSSRLGSYMADPELWDAAFWGVMGGVMFQAGGSKIRQVANRITDKSEATDEAKKERSWWELDELPENKRRISEIWDRRVQFADYKTKLDQINSGKNIFDTDEEGKPKLFVSEAEQQIARDKLMKTYITKMTLRAAHSGNLDMFKEFLADEAVRASFVDQGFFNHGNENKTDIEKDSESKEYIQNIINQVEKVEKEYEDELITVTDAAALIEKNNTPMEYLEIIASENIYSRQMIEDFDARKVAIDERIGELENIFSNSLDQNIDYRSQIKLQVLTNELGHLRAQRKRLVSEKDKSLSNSFAIENIDKKIAEIEDMLDDAELQYATYMSLFYRFENGKIVNTIKTDADVDTKALAYYDRMIIKNTEENDKEGFLESLEELDEFGLSKRSRTYLSQANVGRFNVMLNDTSAVNNLRNISQELNEAYRTSVTLDVKKAWTNNDIYRTVSEVRKRAGEIHNSIDKAREKAIDEANIILQKLYKKYGRNIRNIIYDKVYSTPNEFGDTSKLTESELTKLEDALKILALDKSYNRNLAQRIGEMFEMQDDITASNSDENVNEESQENITNQNPISDTENTEVDNSSLDTTNASTSNESDQFEVYEQQIDPKNIQNRQPAFYANWYKNESGKHRSQDEHHQTAIYDNGDRTFTVVPQNDRDLHNRKFFGNVDEVDLLVPYKPSSYPIARRNKRGKLEIIEKGELTNNIEESVEQEEQVQNNPIEPVDNQQITTKEQEQPIESDTQSDNLSTGEGDNVVFATIDTSNVDTTTQTVEPTPITVTPPVENINPTIDQSSAEEDIMRKSLAKFIKEYKANHDVDFDKLANEIIEAEVKNGADRAIATETVNKSKAIIQRKIAKRLEAKNETMQSSVDEVLITQSSLIEEQVPTDAVSAYQQAVKTMMTQYAKEVNLNRIGGKLYVNLEDLLRYVNLTTSDSKMANMIYSSLKDYLGTEEAKKDFVVIDDENISKDKFLENVAKSQDQRRQERLGDSSVHRVQIDSLEDYTAFDELQQGDKLTISRESNRLSLKDSKGREVGVLPYPSIDNPTGAYKMTNDGWVYDILTNNNGSISSKLRDRFVKWLTSNDQYSKELNEIVYELAYTKPSEERKNELLTKFNNNPEIKKAKEDGLITNNVNSKKLLNGLVKLWRFENRLRTATVEDQNANIADSVNQWFIKLRNSYDNVASLMSGNNDIEIVVNDISDGELIRIVENDKIQAEEQALPINEAIAGEVNPDIYKIAITSRQSGMLEISGSESAYLPSESSGVTMVVIPNRSGNNGFIQAFPAITSADYVGNDIKEIMSAIKEEANKLIKEFADNPSDKAFEDLKEFFKSVFVADRGNNGYSSLFNGLVFKEQKNGFTITSGENGRNFIMFFKNSQYGGFSSKVKIGNSEFKEDKIGNQTSNFDYISKELQDHLERLINNTRIKFNFNYIASDGHTNFNLRGIANKENGEFIIRIGDKTWKYKSFNEFILTNNLARLNTKPNEDGTSNYHRRGERSQRANQTLNIRVVSKTTSPVESVVTPEVATPIAGKSINEQVLDIINSDSNTKGLDIVRTLIGTNPSFTENTLKMFETLDILPNNIIFDENFNSREGYETINAEYNRRTGKITVGKRWLDMFNNPATRSEAVRKLIHEQLHSKLIKNRGFVRSAEEIYDEFKNFVDNNLPQDSPARKYLFENYEDKNIAIEEFLVESLTSKELASYLNQIDADVTKKRGAKNLFQKILELMSKVFGWDIRKGSLYEKELNTLRNLSDTTNKDSQLSLFDNNTNTSKKLETKQEATVIVDKIVEDSSKVNLTPNELYYINEETNSLGVRVTTAIQADEENVTIDKDGNKTVHRFDKDNVWITPSTNIGTGIDEFTRDFFLGKLDNLSNEELQEMYPNVAGEDWNEFRKQLSEFKDKLSKGELIKGKNITIVPRDIKAIGQVDVTMPDGSIKKLDVTGTLDLLGYDQDGMFYIFDMKTVRSKDYQNDVEKSKKWSRQLQIYKQFLEAKYGLKVNGTYIIPIKVNYDTPIGATYKDGNDMGGTAEYTVRNPELKTQYDNPNRSQLLQNCEEFREAAPELKPIFEQKTHKGNIKYEYLDQAAKDVLDGNITVENYKQIEESIQEDKSSEIETSNDDVMDVLDDDLFSSITETEPITIDNSKVSIGNNVPNIQSFSQRLPLSEQSEFDSLVASAAFQTSCR